MSKLEKIRRDSGEFHLDSAVFHIERKYVQGMRVNVSKARER
jgi:hypothetical protein